MGLVTMRNVLFGGALAAAILAGLRLSLDGTYGELVTTLTLIAGCLLFVGGAVVDRLDMLIALRSKE